jgi:hypothetical protein
MATSAPRSCPASAKRSCPNARASATTSAAITRLLYAVPSGSAGLSLAPYPRRSGAMTVWSAARSAATCRHIRWVCGKPCSRTTGLPDPPTAAFSATPSATGTRWYSNPLI